MDSAPGNDAVAIVTCGSCGPGREIARALARRGYAVVVVYLREQGQAEAAVAEILAADGAAIAIRADITDELDVERLFTETAAAFLGADLVVHTAMHGACVVDRHAARRLRRGGAIIDASGCEAIPADLVEALRARDITVNGVVPGVEPPGVRHDLAEVVVLAERWRRDPGT